MKDLLGDEVRVCATHGYQGAGKRKPTIKKGYAAMPGTGPAGETCRTCLHKVIGNSSKHFNKCDLMRAFWTHGEGTDIAARSPACSRWEPNK